MEATAIQSVEKNITMVALANVQPNWPRVFVSRVCYSLLEYAQ